MSEHSNNTETAPRSQNAQEFEITRRTPVDAVREALCHLRAAREYLKMAHADKATDKVRLAMKSAEGAERHALRMQRQSEQSIRDQIYKRYMDRCIEVGADYVRSLTVQGCLAIANAHFLEHDNKPFNMERLLASSDWDFDHDMGQLLRELRDGKYPGWFLPKCMR